MCEGLLPERCLLVFSAKQTTIADQLNYLRGLAYYLLFFSFVYFIFFIVMLAYPISFTSIVFVFSGGIVNLLEAASIFYYVRNATNWRLYIALVVTLGLLAFDITLSFYLGFIFSPFAVIPPMFDAAGTALAFYLLLQTKWSRELTTTSAAEQSNNANTHVEIYGISTGTGTYDPHKIEYSSDKV
jgi:hypothetical protein